MTEPNSSSAKINWSAIGPVIQVLIIAAGMLMGFSHVVSKVDALEKRTDKLYDLLVYPNVARNQLGHDNGNT